MSSLYAPSSTQEFSTYDLTDGCLYSHTIMLCACTLSVATPESRHGESVGQMTYQGLLHDSCSFSAVQRYTLESGGPQQSSDLARRHLDTGCCLPLWPQGNTRLLHQCTAVMYTAFSPSSRQWVSAGQVSQIESTCIASVNIERLILSIALPIVSGGM